eukprot:GHVR01136610.1.p1 GENE.GHVR01136610.1~~GHVR01136610.1.p1  ORF type:complete len:126 (+),score=7.03 GHVR01136610.1:180-557(+)
MTREITVLSGTDWLTNILPSQCSSKGVDNVITRSILFEELPPKSHDLSSNQFENYLELFNRDCNINKVTPEDINNFYTYCIPKLISNSNNYSIKIKFLYKYKRTKTNKTKMWVIMWVIIYLLSIM